MLRTVKNFFLLAIIILLLDYIYLGSVLKDPFMKVIKKIQKKEGKVNLYYATVV